MLKLAGNYTETEDLSTFSSFQNNISSSLYSLTNIPYYYHHQHDQIPVLDFSQPSSSLSCNNSSTSDEAEEIIVNDRKQRRMISNRESARRSRMRKQKQLNELCAHVLRLRHEHDGLIRKLDLLSETHRQVVQENDRLKKEAMELKQLLTEAQLAATFTNLRDLQEDDGGGDDDDEVLFPSCTTQSSNRLTDTSISKISYNLLL